MRLFSCWWGGGCEIKSNSSSSYSLTEPFPAGIAVCIGMASTFAYANSTLREQVALKVSAAFYLLLFPENILFHAQKRLCVEPLIAV